jgi:hypothetical protein
MSHRGDPCSNQSVTDHSLTAATPNSNQADVGTRTRDPLLTMEVLYQLSYVGAKRKS